MAKLPRPPAVPEPQETGTPVTFADVLLAIDRDPDLPRGSRQNLRSAVERAAGLYGAQVPTVPIDIPLLRKKLEKVTAAKLGFQSEGSLASFRSNLNRALRLAGVGVMPGKSRAPLTGAWIPLRERAEAAGLWPALSRFAHWCSERGRDPDAVTPEDLSAFGALMRASCLRSRADKAVPQVAKAWRKAQASIPGWPVVVLPIPRAGRDSGSPPWSAYPASLEAEARGFVIGQDPAEDDWLEAGAVPLRRPATQENYLTALRRAAGELVASGMAPETLRTLSDLTEPDRVKLILQRTAHRTDRKRGGQVSMLAIVLCLAARDHVRRPPAELERLQAMQRVTLQERSMGDRTLERLQPFDDPAKMTALLQLPARLMTKAREHGKADIQSARLVRCAAFLSLLLDTGARQGNIVALRLGSQLHLDARGGGAVTIAGELVKNGQEIRSPLRRETVRVIRIYLETYRPIHGGGSDSGWLFPREDGSHWSTTAAGQTLKELTARHVGADVNPHLIRALLGELILEEQPGALGLVKDVLGHRSVTTSEQFYLRQDRTRARRLHQAVLDRRQGNGR